MVQRSSAVVAFAVIAGCSGRQVEPGHSLPARTEITSASLRSCDLPDERHGAPTFAFDSARLSEHGRETVARIAACVREGRLGPGRLVIVGYTDPRGPSEYNRQLGLYRALAVQQALIDLGVPELQSRVVSQGEDHAKGRDESSWTLDRRVEVRVEDAVEGEPQRGTAIDEPR